MDSNTLKKELQRIKTLKSNAPKSTQISVPSGKLDATVQLKELGKLKRNKTIKLTPIQKTQIDNEIENRKNTLYMFEHSHKLFKEQVAKSKAAKPVEVATSVKVSNVTDEKKQEDADADNSEEEAEYEEDAEAEEEEEEEEEEAEEEPNTNKVIIDIGNELYYLGSPSEQAANDPLSLSNVAYRIQPMSKFIENYCANQHVKNNQNKLIATKEIIRLFKKYFVNSVSKKVLALTNDELIASEGVAMSKNDREHLIMFLTWRAEDLEKKPSKSVSNIKNEKIAKNIRRLIVYFEKSAIKKSVESSKKDVTDMLIRMTWYLLHPDETPATIQGDWNNVLAEMENVDLQTILTAIQSFQEIRGISVSGVEPIREKIKELLVILEGLGDEEEEDEKEEEDKLTEEMKAIAIAVASLIPSTSTVAPAVFSAVAPALSSAAPKAVGGAMQDSSLKSIIVTETMAPIAKHIEQLYPMLSVIKRHTMAPSIDLVMPLQQLLCLCAAISNEKHFGFYRITGVPQPLFNYIQHHIQQAGEEFHTYNNTYHNKRTRQYFLCIDGNLSYIKQPASKEQKAIKTYFQRGDIYILYTNKEINLADYMEDPYYVYEIAYNDINDRMHIKNANSLLNKEPIELEKYLALSPHVFDKHQLDLSIFLQLNHLVQL